MRLRGGRYPTSVIPLVRCRFASTSSSARLAHPYIYSCASSLTRPSIDHAVIGPNKEEEARGGMEATDPALQSQPPILKRWIEARRTSATSCDVLAGSAPGSDIAQQPQSRMRRRLAVTAEWDPKPTVGNRSSAPQRVKFSLSYTKCVASKYLKASSKGKNGVNSTVSMLDTPSIRGTVVPCSRPIPVEIGDKYRR